MTKDFLKKSSQNNINPVLNFSLGSKLFLIITCLFIKLHIYTVMNRVKSHSQALLDGALADLNTTYVNKLTVNNFFSDSLSIL